MTEKQRAYVVEFAKNGGNAKAAAEAAGYTSGDAAVWVLRRNPAVVAEIRRAMGALVMSEGVAVGVSTLLEVARDRGQSGAARTSAATKLVEMGGFLARHGQGGAAQVAEQKAPSEMSVAELDQVAAGLLQAMTRAKVAAAGGDPEAVTLDVTPNAGDGADET